jgi:hypothetical protein
MRATQVRSDKFDMSGKRIRVESRKDHLLSTEVGLQVSYNVDFKYRGIESDVFTPPEELDNIRPAHMPTERVRVLLDDLPVNKSIQTLFFKGDTGVGHFEHSPAYRAHLLPYLTEDRVFKNSAITTGEIKIYNDNGWTTPDGTPVSPPEEHRGFVYYPQVLGMMCVGIETPDNQYTQKDVYNNCAIMPVAVPIDAVFEDKIGRGAYATFAGGKTGDEPGDNPGMMAALGQYREFRHTLNTAAQEDIPVRVFI